MQDNNYQICMDKLVSTGFIAMNKILVTKLGVVETLFLSALMDKHKYFLKKNIVINDDDFFYFIRDDMEQEFGVTVEQQKRVSPKMAKLGLIEIKMMGSPYRKYFKINYEKIYSLFMSGNNKSQQEMELDRIEEEEKLKKANNRMIAYRILVFSCLLRLPFVMVNKILLCSLGVMEAFYLSIMIDKYAYFFKENKLDKEGLFYLARTAVQKEYTISSCQQTRLLRDLSASGLLQSRLQGMPCQLYYHLDFNRIREALELNEVNFRKKRTVTLNATTLAACNIVLSTVGDNSLPNENDSYCLEEMSFPERGFDFAGVNPSNLPVSNPETINDSGRMLSHEDIRKEDSMALGKVEKSSGLYSYWDSKSYSFESSVSNIVYITGKKDNDSADYQAFFCPVKACLSKMPRPVFRFATTINRSKTKDQYQKKEEECQIKPIDLQYNTQKLQNLLSSPDDPVPQFYLGTDNNKESIDNIKIEMVLENQISKDKDNKDNSAKQIKEEKELDPVLIIRKLKKYGLKDNQIENIKRTKDPKQVLLCLDELEWVLTNKPHKCTNTATYLNGLLFKDWAFHEMEKTALNQIQDMEKETIFYIEDNANHKMVCRYEAYTKEQYDLFFKALDVSKQMEISLEVDEKLKNQKNSRFNAFKVEFYRNEILRTEYHVDMMSFEEWKRTAL